MKRRDFFRKTGAASVVLAAGPMLSHALAKSAWADDGEEAGRKDGCVILEIDIEQTVDYFNDVTEYSRLANDPNITTLSDFNDFGAWISVGDIVAVNGETAKGTFLARAMTFRLSPRSPGDRRERAIADVTRNNFGDFYWEILRADSTPLGTIVAIGTTFGSPPPGAPSAQVRDNLAVIGGTGAFLGVRGQAGSRVTTFMGRAGSLSEDPARRRINGGGPRRYVLQLFFPESKKEDKD